MAETQVLIVEDESIVAKDIQNTLRSLGYGVSAIASSGEEAIKKAAETHPDLALMDIVLGGDIDGVEAAAQIRARFDIPVVYLTAYADDNTLQRAKIAEPYGYILKPFQERELHTTIEIALYKHKMERRLKESQQWLATTLKSIGDAVIATDSHGCVIFMNPVAEALTGWEQEDAAGNPLKTVFNIINEETGKQAEDPATKVLREGVVVGLANHTVLIAKDGTKRPIDDSGAPIGDDKGNIIGVVLVFRDITEKRKREEELLKADKLESVGILAGGIAHDFNNVLASIIGNISLAKMHLKPGSKIFDLLSAAETASMRARRLTGQLLTYAKGGAPVKETASIQRLIKESSLFVLQGSISGCEFSIAEDLWPVEADMGQISQIISNIVINANQAMPEGGIIRVAAENLVLEEKNEMSVKPGRYIRISIKDQGTGIDEKHLSKIFDPYFTTKNEGSGLGLATAYSIIKKHNGHISVDSLLGAGTTFSIYLPASDKAIPVKEEAALLTGEGKILLMDDDRMLREMANGMLEMLGYEVEFAENGAEAIEMYRKAKESEKPYDAVILDLTIPGGMGGKEAVKKLLELDPQLKAIVCSGYSDDPVMPNYREYGFKGMMAKPFDLQALGKVLNDVLNSGS